MNEDGLIVLTGQYHLEKGYCCGNGCKHCPYDYINVPEPRRSELKASGLPQTSINKNRRSK